MQTPAVRKVCTDLTAAILIWYTVLMTLTDEGHTLVDVMIKVKNMKALFLCLIGNLKKKNQRNVPRNCSFCV